MTWLNEQLITPVAQKPFDGKALKRSRTMLVHLGSTERQDYDSARQIAWALRTLCCDVAQSPQVQAIFAELDRRLGLDLTNGLGDDCIQPDTPSPSRETPQPLAGSVPTALAMEVRYDADWFRETMVRLKTLLK